MADWNTDRKRSFSIERAKNKCWYMFPIAVLTLLEEPCVINKAQQADDLLHTEIDELK
jgi:hypothetical protein